MTIDYGHLDALPRVLEVDNDYVQVKDRQYGASWKKRGGVGAFMMMARKWDRLENMLPAFHMDVFAAIEAQTVHESENGIKIGSDGTILAEVRDLRRYLALVEAEMVSRGCVTPAKLTTQDTRPGEPVEEGDLWSDVAARWGVSRRVAKERGLALLFGEPSPDQLIMASDMASDRVDQGGPRIVTHETQPTHIIDGTGVRIEIGDPVYVKGRRDAGELAAIKTHGDAERPLLVRFRPESADGRDLEEWFPLRGTVYARQARAFQEPQERFTTERRVPRYGSSDASAVETSASAAGSAVARARADASSNGEDPDYVPGTPEDGGHHASAAEAQASTAEVVVEETVPFSHEIRREQRELQWKEWSMLEHQLISHGTMTDTPWQKIYLGPEAEGNHTGRYLMLPALQDEYAH